MERNDDLRTAENERAAELRDIESSRADAGDEGYTTRDSLVRDDSLVGGRSGVPADRTVRATERVDRNVETVVGHDLDRDHSPTIGDQVGEAAGGIGGVLAGAAIGSIGGPIGTVIGGIAGAIGGWWTGRAISEAASNFSRSDDEEFRTDYESRVEAPASNPNRAYERVRPAYQLGYLASRNPEYAGRSFEDIEPHLERGWNGNAETVSSDWNDMRDYARTAYVRGAASQSSLTGDSSAKNSLSSTGTSGSAGIGSEAPHEDPAGTSRRADPTTSFAGGSVSQPSSSSSDNSDASARLASPKGSSFTRQGDVPLNTSATDSIGVSRNQDADKQASAESGELRGSEPNRGPSFTDPVAGEGVENIGSSGLSPRGDEGTLNERVPENDGRTNRDRTSEQY